MVDDNSEPAELDGKDQNKGSARGGRPGGYELTELAIEGLGALRASMSFSDIAGALGCSTDRSRVISRKTTKGSKPARVSSKVIANIASLLLMDCNKVAKDLDGPLAEQRNKHLPTLFEKLEAGAVLRAIDQGITPLFDLSELPAELAVKIKPLLKELKVYEEKTPEIFRDKLNPWGRNMTDTESFLSTQNKVFETLAELTELDLYGGQVVEFTVQPTLDRYDFYMWEEHDATGYPVNVYATCHPARVHRKYGFVIRSFPATGESAPIRFHQVYSGFNYSELKKEVTRKFTDWNLDEIRGQKVPYFVDGESLVDWHQEYAVKDPTVFGRGVNIDGPDDEYYVTWTHDE